MESLISVIVPVYKVEDYLERCVDSLLNQTYQNIELILVDDGSPDCCGKLCDEYACKDSRIRVIHKKNGGLSDARNVAISLVEGDYVSFVDSDDWVSPFYLENLYNAIKKSDSDMAVSWFENVFDNKTIISEPSNELRFYECLGPVACLKKLLYQNGVEVSAWGKLYKRSVIQSLRYPVGKLYEDIPVTYEAIKRSNTIAVIGNIDYYYFQRVKSIQNEMFSVRKLDAVQHCKAMMSSVKKDYPELGIAAECRYLSTVCNILFQIKDEQYLNERDMLWQEVVKYRKDVMLDRQARKKARLAALVSFGGYKFMRAVYCKTQWRGRA